MEISADKIKILINSIKPRSSTNIWTIGKMLMEVDQFKYLGSKQTTDGTYITKENKDQTGACIFSHDNASNTMENKAMRFPTKIKLYKSLVLSTLLYKCESWTLTAVLERRTQAFENKCSRRILDISHTVHKKR